MTSAIEFTMGDLFPANDRLARWVTVCCMAFNDSMQLNVQMLEQFEAGTAPDWSNVYLSKLVASHLHEAARFLAQSERRLGDKLSTFLGGLTPDARATYERVKSLGPGESSEFARRLKTLRNHSFHYAEMLSPEAEDYEDLRSAMAEHEDRLYRLEATEVFKDFRASFADDVATELAFKGDEGLSEFVQELAETVTAFLNFCNDVLAHYIATRTPESHRYVS